MANESPKVARLATDTVTNATSTISQAAETTTAKTAGFAEAGTTQLRTTMERSMEQASKAAEGSFKAAQEFAEFSRGNAETLAQVAQTWMVGTQDLSRQFFAFGQSLTDHALEGARALAGVKSLKEAAEIQANYARGTMDKVMSETAKLQEASLRLAEQVATPVTQRVSLAMERAAKPLAA
ncbi:phasin family protein [Roseomonas sp. SSH11]|uniref:Phasin family protein n=1 Tax=Pararoseomonas baculiformis TaxID=2820812 RepID=A0ABS4AJW6_9PROT|nr:phasin family protein [Pararoseomonas baculiformis]MBP0446785.1 phasin family protein [Pararoseomonas baculiformis]